MILIATVDFQLLPVTILTVIQNDHPLWRCHGVFVCACMCVPLQCVVVVVVVRFSVTADQSIWQTTVACCSKSAANLSSLRSQSLSPLYFFACKHYSSWWWWLLTTRSSLCLIYCCPLHQQLYIFWFANYHDWATVPPAASFPPVVKILWWEEMWQPTMCHHWSCAIWQCVITDHVLLFKCSIFFQSVQQRESVSPIMRYWLHVYFFQSVQQCHYSCAIDYKFISLACHGYWFQVDSFNRSTHLLARACLHVHFWYSMISLRTQVFKFLCVLKSSNFFAVCCCKLLRLLSLQAESLQVVIWSLLVTSTYEHSCWVLWLSLNLHQNKLHSPPDPI